MPISNFFSSYYDYDLTIICRVCISYLSQSNITNLTPDSCTLLFTLNTTESAAAIQHINQETNSWIKWTTLASYLPSIVTDCFIGGWGDLFGRSSLVVDQEHQSKHESEDWTELKKLFVFRFTFGFNFGFGSCLHSVSWSTTIESL